MYVGLVATRNEKIWSDWCVEAPRIIESGVMGTVGYSQVYNEVSVVGARV